MKLATFHDGTREGALMIVSRNLTRAVRAQSVIAGLHTLQQLLDDWESTYLKVERISAEIDESATGRRATPFETVEFDAVRCTAPLPRAFQWADGSAYVNHVELVRRARGAEMPASFWTEPLMYQGGSDSLARPMRRDRADETRPGVSISKARWPSSPTTCRWARRLRAGRRMDPSRHARQRCVAAQPDPGRSWPRASASFTASRRRRSRRSL